jgi:hypothetical protein
MPTATLLRRSLTPLAGLTLALLGSCLLPATVRAAGFSGSFDPANWSIINTTDGTVDETLTSSGSPPTTAADYSCGIVNDVACVENISAASGAVEVVGSSSVEVNGGGTPNTLRTTTWTVTNGSEAALLSFDWALNTFPNSGDTNQSVSYLVGLSETVIGSGSGGGNGNFSGIALAAGESFGFRVTTANNVGDYGILSITNFTAATVPGPLPLAGGIAAFSWSRRLRRRIGSSPRA